MHTLPVSFALLTYTGYWRPVGWPRYTLKYWLYNVFSVITVFILNSFAFHGFMEAILNEDVKIMIEKLSLNISVIGVCCKVANLFIRRDKIISVLNLLLRDNCTPRDQEETIIHQRFDQYARKLTIYCEFLNVSAAVFGAVSEINRYFQEGIPRTEKSISGSPSETNTLLVIAILYESICLIMCASTSVAHETLISGLMIQTCAQLEIFCHRTRCVPALLKQARDTSKTEGGLIEAERRIIGDLVRYHLEIYQFAVTVNAVFNLMIFLQFSISSTVLCLCVYQMSRADPLSVEFLYCLSYLGSMLVQIYLYCWFGNEVTLQSVKVSEAVYEMDWTTLPLRVIKDLLIIMARSSRPIKMSSGHVVTLSAESFMNIMKASYSSYNLLKDSSN